MKKSILVIALSIICSAGVAQYNKPKVSATPSDSIVVKPSPFQMETITTLQKQIVELQTQLDHDLMLILGVKKEDIQTIAFKNGEFIVTLKPKKQ